MKILYYKNKEIIVDDHIFEAISKRSWQINNSGYVRTTIKSNGKYRTQYLHRLILDNPKDLEIDHINGNKLDNRIENLRIVDRSLNVQRSRKFGFNFNVDLRLKTNMYFACIRKNKIHISLGSFSTKEDAAYYKDILTLFFNDKSRKNQYLNKLNL